MPGNLLSSEIVIKILHLLNAIFGAFKCISIYLLSRLFTSLFTSDDRVSPALSPGEQHIR